MLQDNGSWLRTLRRDNVELVRTAIERITPDGIETVDGTHHPADVIIYATGFRANEMLLPMTITGRGGADLRAGWGERPTAYLGITMPEFPNFFCMYGPGTNLASSGSIIFHSECQAHYIVAALGHIADNELACVEPKVEKTRDWVERSQQQMRGMVWSQPSVKHSVYKNAYGEVYIVSPWRVVDYWSWTREFDPGDYVIRKRAELASARSTDEYGEPPREIDHFGTGCSRRLCRIGCLCFRYDNRAGRRQLPAVCVPVGKYPVHSQRPGRKAALSNVSDRGPHLCGRAGTGQRPKWRTVPAWI
jgi:hypothetical protein